MKLYTTLGNPTGRKVEAVLKHLNLGYSVEVLSFQDGDTRTDAYKKINPNGLIPALVDGDKVIWDSNAINMYLCTEKVENTSLFPKEHASEITQWMFWEASQYNASLRTMIFELMVKPAFNLGERSEEIVELGKTNAERWASVLNEHLEGRSFMVGDDWTLADYCVGYIEPMIERLPVDLTPFPNVVSFYDRFRENEYWKATVLNKPKAA